MDERAPTIDRTPNGHIQDSKGHSLEGMAAHFARAHNDTVQSMKNAENERDSYDITHETLSALATKAIQQGANEDDKGLSVLQTEARETRDKADDARRFVTGEDERRKAGLWDAQEHLRENELEYKQAAREEAETSVDKHGNPIQITMEPRTEELLAQANPIPLQPVDQ